MYVLRKKNVVILLRENQLSNSQTEMEVKDSPANRHARSPRRRDEHGRAQPNGVPEVRAGRTRQGKRGNGSGVSEPESERASEPLSRHSKAYKAYTYIIS